MTSLHKISRTPSNENFQVTYPSGNIKILSEFQRKRYEDAPDEDCFTIKFTEEGLKNLQEKYREVRGIPTFIYGILNDKPSQRRENLFKRPEQFELFKAGEDHFFISPNLPHMSFEDRIKDPKNVKNTEKGVALCAWYIPNTDIWLPVAQALLDNTQYKSLKKKHEDMFLKDKDALRYGEIGTNERNIIEGHKALGRTYSLSKEMQKLQRFPTQKSISEIEQETGERYLASIVDITEKDIPMLKALREKVYAHLKKVYDVDAFQDDAKLFFHFPYTTDSVTLHLHIRTTPTHPLDDSRSFELDEIIEKLNSGKTMSNMILAKKSVGENLPGAYLRTTSKDDWYNYLCDIKGVTFAPAKNPKLLSNLPYHDTKSLAKAESTSDNPFIPSLVKERAEMPSISGEMEQER